MYVRIASPVPMVETVPIPPGPDYNWLPGAWVWVGDPSRFSGGAGGSGAAFAINEFTVVISCPGYSCPRHGRSEEPQLHRKSLTNYTITLTFI